MGGITWPRSSSSPLNGTQPSWSSGRKSLEDPQEKRVVLDTWENVFTLSLQKKLVNCQVPKGPGGTPYTALIERWESSSLPESLVIGCVLSDVKN